MPARVYPDRASYVAAAGLPRDSTIVGLATFPDGVIHIDGGGLLVSIEKVVPHEVAHVMVARALGPALPSLPLWVNEGIAEYAAGQRAARVDPLTLRALGRGEALPLRDLDHAFHAGNRHAPAAYTQAASVIHFLVAERGEEVMPALLRAVREHRQFEPALQQTTGWSLPELEARWRRSLASRWRWALLLRSPTLPLGLMLLLFIVGLIRHLWERRRRQELPDEDW